MIGYNDIPIVCPYCDRQVPQVDWIAERARCKYCAERVIVSLQPAEVDYCKQKAQEIIERRQKNGQFQTPIDKNLNPLDAEMLGTVGECAVHKYLELPFSIEIYDRASDTGDVKVRGMVLGVKAVKGGNFRGLRMETEQFEKYKAQGRLPDGFIAIRRLMDYDWHFWEIIGTITTKVFEQKKKLVEFTPKYPAMLCVEECDLNHPRKIKAWAQN